mmetsp:Transcript_16156/g.52258  ORF Transcript_16156/g.52258 Transcript_16156/m.52258 type:complete len:206 (+) Transcript_16156:155-772(+)
MASRPAARGESVELVLEMDAARPPLLVQRERPFVLAPRADEQRRDGPAGRHPAGLEGRWHSVRIHLPHDEAERVDVGLLVGALPRQNLGGGVGGRPAARPRERVVELLGEPHIGELRHVVRRDEDVEWLDVKMDEPAAVQVEEPLCCVEEDAPAEPLPPELGGVCAQAVLERTSLHQLGDDEELARRVAAVALDDVPVPQGAEQL